MVVHLILQLSWDSASDLKVGPQLEFPIESMYLHPKSGEASPISQVNGLCKEPRNLGPTLLSYPKGLDSMRLFKQKGTALRLQPNFGVLAGICRAGAFGHSGSHTANPRKLNEAPLGAVSEDYERAGDSANQERMLLPIWASPVYYACLPLMIEILHDLIYQTLGIAIM